MRERVCLECGARVSDSARQCPECYAGGSRLALRDVPLTAEQRAIYEKNNKPVAPNDSPFGNSPFDFNSGTAQFAVSQLQSTEYAQQENAEIVSEDSSLDDFGTFSGGFMGGGFSSGVCGVCGNFMTHPVECQNCGSSHYKAGLGSRLNPALYCSGCQQSYASVFSCESSRTGSYPTIKGACRSCGSEYITHKRPVSSGSKVARSVVTVLLVAVVIAALIFLGLSDAGREFLLGLR